MSSDDHDESNVTITVEAPSVDAVAAAFDLEPAGEADAAGRPSSSPSSRRSRTSTAASGPRPSRTAAAARGSWSGSTRAGRT